MSDAPEWLADAVEAAVLAHCAAICGEGQGCETPCPGCLAGQCAALAAFLRSFPSDATLRRWKDRETGHVARLPGRELHYLAAAIERLGAPEKPEGGA